MHATQVNMFFLERGMSEGFVVYEDFHDYVAADFFFQSLFHVHMHLCERLLAFVNHHIDK